MHFPICTVVNPTIDVTNVLAGDFIFSVSDYGQSADYSAANIYYFFC